MESFVSDKRQVGVAFVNRDIGRNCSIIHFCNGSPRAQGGCSEPGSGFSIGLNGRLGAGERSSNSAAPGDRKSDEPADLGRRQRGTRRVMKKIDRQGRRLIDVDWIRICGNLEHNPWIKCQ